MADADSFVREEILGIFLGMLDESELDHLYHLIFSFISSSYCNFPGFFS